MVHCVHRAVINYSRPRVAPAIAEDCYVLVVLSRPPYGIGQAIIFFPCAFFYLLSIYLLSFSSPNLSRRRLDVYHTSTHGTSAMKHADDTSTCIQSGLPASIDYGRPM